MRYILLISLCLMLGCAELKKEVEQARKNQLDIEEKYKLGDIISHKCNDHKYVIINKASDQIKVRYANDLGTLEEIWILPCEIEEK